MYPWVSDFSSHRNGSTVLVVKGERAAVAISALGGKCPWYPVT